MWPLLKRESRCTIISYDQLCMVHVHSNLPKIFQIRRSLPAHFHEIELNVYSTSQEHHALYECNKENFDK